MTEPNGERFNDILHALSEGQTRDQLVQQYQLKNRHSLDQYMRRKGYRWDGRQGTYVKWEQSQPRVISSRVLDIIAEFQKPNADAKDIAKRLRFASHHDMAQYMQARGYVWSTENHNYVSVYGEPIEEISDSNTETESAEWERYLPVLSLLIEHQDKLIRLLEQTLPTHSEVPRYLVPGIYTVKSIHMVSNLNELVKRFSQENNISQREIFEVALIDFFRNYGFAQEIDVLLSK